MKLYHGSNTDIEHIDLTKGLHHKDFGKGFYLTDSRDTAIKMARKKARLFGGQATLITYDLNEEAYLSDLNVKIFPKTATAEWFLFIDANRNKQTENNIHGYDIVIGPIADDGVVLQLTYFKENILSPEQAAKALQDKYLDQQYYFGTEKALTYLKKLSSEQL